MKVYFNNQDIKDAKLALVNQELTSFQTAILAQHINDLEYRVKKVIELIQNDNKYDDSDFESRNFQKDILKILGVNEDENRN